MLQRNYTPELIDHVKETAGEVELNAGNIEAIIIDAEEVFGDIGLTPYNVRQIVKMRDVEFLDAPDAEISQDIIKRNYDEGPFIKTFQKQKEKDYIKKSRILASMDDFLEHMSTFLEGYTPPKITGKIKTPSSKHNGETIIALTDLHLGKNNTTSIHERLDILARNIIDQKFSVVHIMCLGDLIEAIMEGGMHTGQVEGMDGIYGFDLLMHTVAILENFLYSIAKEGTLVYFHGISGNHDRISQHRDNDHKRIGAFIIYELVKRGLDGIENIDINIYKEYINTIDIAGIRYIITHGDIARINKRKGSDIAWTHGDNTMAHNVILYGHYHTVQIQEEKDITKIGLPGLAGAGFYDSKMLDVHSEPGYVQIDHNEYGSIDIKIKRLMNAAD